MKLRNFAAILLLAIAALAQQNDDSWKTAVEFPNLDWHGLTGPKKQAALKFLRTESCACGCGDRIAECRMKDPGCGMSRKFATAVVEGFVQGKSEAQIKEVLKKLATEAPPTLEEAVKISTDGDPVEGPANAKYTIVEFSDFQCPWCMKAVAAAKQLLKQNPNVKLIFKQFPLDSHRDAEFGAEAALSAQAQGKFWQMHDKLYAGFPDLSRKTVFGYAQQMGLDMKQFTADMDSHKFAKRVAAERKEGMDISVDGTPTFFINGRKYNGVFEVANVEAALKTLK